MSLTTAAILPLLLVLFRRRAAWPMLATTAATLAASTLALYAIDPDDVAVLIVSMIVTMPLIVITTSVIVSVAVVPRPRKVFDAGFFAMCGWWLGVMMMFFGSPSTAMHGVLECAGLVALPSMFAAAGAAFGATNPLTPT